MATTVTTNQPYPDGFSVLINSDDLTGCEEAVAAVSGKSHYLTSVYIQHESAGALLFTIGAGSAAGEPETVLLGPFPVVLARPLELQLSRPIVAPAGKAITVDASNSGTNASIELQGFTR